MIPNKGVRNYLSRSLFPCRTQESLMAGVVRLISCSVTKSEDECPHMLSSWISSRRSQEFLVWSFWACDWEGVVSRLVLWHGRADRGLGGGTILSLLRRRRVEVSQINWSKGYKETCSIQQRIYTASTCISIKIERNTHGWIPKLSIKAKLKAPHIILQHAVIQSVTIFNSTRKSCNNVVVAAVVLCCLARIQERNKYPKRLLLHCPYLVS